LLGVVGEQRQAAAVVLVDLELVLDLQLLVVRQLLSLLVQAEPSKELILLLVTTELRLFFLQLVQLVAVAGVAVIPTMQRLVVLVAGVVVQLEAVLLLEV